MMMSSYEKSPIFTNFSKICKFKISSMTAIEDLKLSFLGSIQNFQTTNYLHAQLFEVFGHEFLLNSLKNWGFLPNFSMATQNL
jgi:hypothetical protein